MTTERDELAKIITAPESYDGGPASCGPNDVYAARTADAILAAGYRKPQQVTTVEELDALPVGAVLLDSMDGPVVKVGGWWHSAYRRFAPDEIAFPATVLHVGDAK